MPQVCKPMNAMEKKNREVITHCFSEDKRGHPVSFSLWVLLCHTAEFGSWPLRAGSFGVQQEN